MPWVLRKRRSPPDSSNQRELGGMPIGATANRLKVWIVCAPGGRLRFALAIRSLSRINGEFEIIVMLVPHRIMQAIGSNRRFSGRPVRELIRLTTGRNTALSAWLWITDE